MSNVESGILQKISLLSDPLANDSAVMNKEPKGISKRLQVADSQDTIDRPQAKRQRGDDRVFSLPSSPASNSMVLDHDSTSPPREKTTRPKADFERVMEIHTVPYGDWGTFIVHEHLLRPLSRLVQEYRPRKQDDRLKWECTIDGHYMRPQTIRFFLHWLYHNSLGSAKSANGGDLSIEDIEDHQLRTKIQRMQETSPEYSVAACKAALEKKRFNHNDALEYLASTDVQDNVCGFTHLLDLYFFADHYAIIILKNVIIDHLIEETPHHYVPTGWSKTIYSRTKPGDQLRRLWVDFYVWRVDDEQLDDEQREDWLDSTFLKDLVRAQARQLRGNKISETAPFDEDSTAYHVRDETTGQCCCRTQFEGDKYEHRGEFIHEQLEMQNAQARIVELERKNSELRKTLRAQKDQSNGLSALRRASDILPNGTKPSSSRR